MSSTPAIFVPKLIGKVETTLSTLSSCRTTDCATKRARSVACMRDVIAFGDVGGAYLEVAEVLRAAVKRRELALLEDGLEGLGAGGARALGLLAHEVVERGLDGDDEVAAQRVLRVGRREGGALGERVLVGRLGEHGLGRGRGGVLVGANGHPGFCSCF